MAIAERHLAAVFGGDIVDHATYVLASDGDLMEGISQEAIALAGHLRLNKLIVLYRRQRHLHRRPARACRFRRSGQALRSPPAGRRRAIDGHDPAAIAAALEAAKKSRPTVADRLPHHYRLRRAEQGAAPRRPTARRSAPRRSPARGRSSAGARRPSKFRPPSASSGAPPARAAARRGSPGKPASPRSIRRTRAEFERRMRGDLPAKSLPPRSPA